MKIKIKENSIDPVALKEALESRFEGKYEISNRSPKLLVVAQNKTVGATILVRKNSLIVNGNFSTMGMQIVFTLILVLLGILIPIILYFAIFHSKMKAVEKETADFIKEKYIEELV